MTLSEIKSTYLIYCLHAAVSVPIDTTHKYTHEEEKEEEGGKDLMNTHQEQHNTLTDVYLLL